MSEAKKRMGRQKTASKIDNTSAVGSTHFVGIGINDYQNWPSLQNAVRDVQAIADLLVSDYGFNKNQLRLLLNEKATEANIIQLFEELADQVTPGDSLLIYYAGHGHLNQRGRGFWVPVDAPEGSVFRYIRNSTIKDYIGDINSLHTLLISDACFSGSLFSSGTERASDLVADELARLPSRWAVCSGRHDEVVADGPREGHSPFAESILDVLRNNKRPAITTGFLVNQVIEQTRSNYEQLPDGGPLQNVGHKRGQFVFRRQKGVSANLLWQQIESAADDTLAEIAAKKALIRQYAKDYPAGNHFSAALQLGRQLEHKHQMLEAWDSEFGLMAFVQKDTPFKQEAQRRLQILRDHTKQNIPNRQQEEERKATSTNTWSSQSQTKNSITQPTPTPEKKKGNANVLSQGWLVILIAVFFAAIMPNPAIIFVNINYLPLALILLALLIWASYRLGLKASSPKVIGWVAFLAGLFFFFGTFIIGLLEIYYLGSRTMPSLILIVGTSFLVFSIATFARHRKR